MATRIKTCTACGETKRIEEFSLSRNGRAAKKPGIDRRTGKPRRLAVDHCHETARVRGLLCGNCNVGLGMFADNPGLLRRALGYVEGGGRHRNEN